VDLPGPRRVLIVAEQLAAGRALAPTDGTEHRQDVAEPALGVEGVVAGHLDDQARVVPCLYPPVIALTSRVRVEAEGPSSTFDPERSDAAPD
jgi:hypothetical protein